MGGATASSRLAGHSAGIYRAMASSATYPRRGEQAGPQAAKIYGPSVVDCCLGTAACFSINSCVGKHSRNPGDHRGVRRSMVVATGWRRVEGNGILVSRMLCLPRTSSCNVVFPFLFHNTTFQMQINDLCLPLTKISLNPHKR